MKCTIPEISWHNRVPVLSVDLQPGKFKSSTEGDFWRLASGGSDSHVLIWHLTVSECGKASVSCVADLERHQKTVNVVRFSPSGEFLASGDDESMIIIWKQRESSEIPFVPNDDDFVSKEHWNSLKVLRGHVEDVYDLSWSPNSNLLASSSLDNSVILWNVEKSKKICILNDYAKGFPQGVSWDPTGKYVASMSSDRICRLIDVNLKKTVQRVSKSKIPTPSGHALEGKVVRLFYDDTFKSYFRRLTYSPDGMLLLVPSGIIEPQESTEKIVNCLHIFSRHSLREPIAVLPSYEEVTNAVRCCPVYFKLREDGPSTIDLPYRMVFAVATDNSVMIYDTQQISPIAVISNIHYTRLTDVTWSSDGRVLVASSSDGYCSIIYFEEGELGEVYERNSRLAEQPKDTVKEDAGEIKSTQKTFLEIDTNAVDIDLSHKTLEEKASDEKNSESPDEREKVDSPEKQWSATEDNIEYNKLMSKSEDEDDFQLVLEDTVADSDKLNTKATPPKTQKPDKPVTPIAVRTPRRVQLITISSPKGKKD